MVVIAVYDAGQAFERVPPEEVLQAFDIHARALATQHGSSTVAVSRGRRFKVEFVHMVCRWCVRSISSGVAKGFVDDYVG